jgi:hypothetical protein
MRSIEFKTKCLKFAVSDHHVFVQPITTKWVKSQLRAVGVKCSMRRKNVLTKAICNGHLVCKVGPDGIQ